MLIETARRNARWLRRLVRCHGLVVPRTQNPRTENEATIAKDGLSDDGLIVVMAPCFKSGGYDFYANRSIAGLLDAALSCFGLCEPILVCRGPIGIRQETRYQYKIVSGVEWYGDFHKSVAMTPNEKS